MSGQGEGRQPYWLVPLAGLITNRGAPPPLSRPSCGPNKSTMAPAERDRSRKIGSSPASNRSMALNVGMISRGVCCSCRYGRGKLRRDIAVEDGRADMVEAALKISPDFAADIGPALAEGEILAEIGPGLRIDHAVEQCKPVGTSSE